MIYPVFYEHLKERMLAYECLMSDRKLETKHQTILWESDARNTACFRFIHHRQQLVPSASPLRTRIRETSTRSPKRNDDNHHLSKDIDNNNQFVMQLPGHMARSLSSFSNSDIDHLPPFWIYSEMLFVWRHTTVGKNPKARGTSPDVI